MEIIQPSGAELAISRKACEPDTVEIHLCDPWTCHNIRLTAHEVDRVIAELVRLRGDM